jgi:SlyX protein
MTATLEQRLTELETRFAFLEQTAQSLDSTVAAQDRLLAQLRRQYDSLYSELSQLRVGLQDDVRDEPPPPHY